jgi:hypothetical protein
MDKLLTNVGSQTPVNINTTTQSLLNTFRNEGMSFDTAQKMAGMGLTPDKLNKVYSLANSGKLANVAPELAKELKDKLFLAKQAGGEGYIKNVTRLADMLSNMGSKSMIQLELRDIVNGKY